jgi:hypothetical protein
MFDEIELVGEFFARLSELDEAIVSRAAEAGCRFCGGPLHRGDYPRKPRGGLVAAFGEAFTRRYSLCCGRDGCRHRATPPCRFAASCSHLRADFRRVMQPPVLQPHAATSERG